MRYLFLAALLYVLYILGRRFIRRKLRGEATPDGPRTITFVAAAVILAYCALLIYRLLGHSGT